MKKAFVTALSLAALIVAGCSDEKNMEPQTPEDSKEFFKSNAENVLNAISASDFKTVSAFIDSTAYAGDVSDLPDSLSKVMRRALKALKNEESDTTYRIDPVKAIAGTKVQTINITKATVYSLSAFTGKYTVDAKGNCTVEKSDDLSIELNNSKLGKLGIKITKSDKYTAVKYAIFDNDTTYTNYYNNMMTYKIYNGYIVVEVPKEVELVATIDGKDICSVKLTAELDTEDGWVKNGTPDYEKVLASTGKMSMMVSAAGYEMGFSNVSVDGKNGLASFSLKKDNKCIIDVNAAVKGYSFEVDDEKVKSTTAIEKIMPRVSASVENLALSVNLMDEIQVKAAVSVDDLIEAYTKSITSSELDDESIAAIIEEMNSTYEVGVYFGDNTKQAEIALMKAEGKNKAIPCIEFVSDGSKYTLEEYFTSEEFQSVITMAKVVAYDFMNIMPKLDLE